MPVDYTRWVELRLMGRKINNSSIKCTSSELLVGLRKTNNIDIKSVERIHIFLTRV